MLPLSSTTAQSPLTPPTPLDSLSQTAAAPAPLAGAVARPDAPVPAASTVDFSPTAQFLSAAQLSQGQLAALQEALAPNASPRPGTESFAFVSTAAQSLVDGFNLLQAGGIDFDQSAPGTALLNSLVQDLTAPAAANQASQAAQLARLGITLQPPLLADQAGGLSLDAQILRSAFDAEPQATVDLLSQTSAQFVDAGRRFAQQLSASAQAQSEQLGLTAAERAAEERIAVARDEARSLRANPTPETQAERLAQTQAATDRQLSSSRAEDQAASALAERLAAERQAVGRQQQAALQQDLQAVQTDAQRLQQQRLGQLEANRQGPLEAPGDATRITRAQQNTQLQQDLQAQNQTVVQRQQDVARQDAIDRGLQNSQRAQDNAATALAERLATQGLVAERQQLAGAQQQRQQDSAVQLTAAQAAAQAEAQAAARAATQAGSRAPVGTPVQAANRATPDASLARRAAEQQAQEQQLARLVQQPTLAQAEAADANPPAVTAQLQAQQANLAAAQAAQRAAADAVAAAEAQLVEEQAVANAQRLAAQANAVRAQTTVDQALARNPALAAAIAASYLNDAAVGAARPAPAAAPRTEAVPAVAPVRAVQPVAGIGDADT